MELSTETGKFYSKFKKANANLERLRVLLKEGIFDSMEHEVLCKNIALKLNVSHTQAWQYLQYLKIEKSIKFKIEDPYTVGKNRIVEENVPKE